MVKGLDLFLAHFRAFNDRFVLIGGTACDMAMTEAGLEFRATRDLDIVLWVEALDEPTRFGEPASAAVKNVAEPLQYRPLLG